jgi:hypothetical protein
VARRASATDIPGAPVMKYVFIYRDREAEVEVEEEEEEKKNTGKKEEIATSCSRPYDDKRWTRFLLFFFSLESRREKSQVSLAFSFFICCQDSCLSYTQVRRRI